MYGDRSAELLQALAELDHIVDVHVETNGAIELEPFIRKITNPKVRYIMDVKLPESGEMEKMIWSNLAHLRKQDELKFVIGSDDDFAQAKRILEEYPTEALPLFSPVWETMPPATLVGLMLEHRLSNVKLNMQLHKIIWDPKQRGV